MRWGVLGPLRVETAAGDALALPGPVRRLLLAALLSRANTVVSADTLSTAVWGELPPRSAAKTLQSHLVRLRDDLGRDELATTLVTEPSGYRLNVEVGALDALRFEELVTAAGRATDTATALTTYDEALALWRGAAYEDFPDADFLVPERLRLTELHDLAEEQRADVALSCGQSAELVPGLEARVQAAPYRERSWEQLVLALYRSGRQADALGAYRRARDLLASELGVDPGPGLQNLETRILHQDPTLLDGVQVASTSLALDTGRCPYRGLDGYGDDDASVFVGRERLVARLAGLCADSNVVVVTGASGAGKSSLVRAGLVPALRRGALPESAAWRTVVTSPTEAAGAARPTTDLLVVDQAEELFTRLDDTARAATADALAQHVADDKRLVLVIRGDFYGRLAELTVLAGYVGRATLLVGPPRDDELARVVTEPAQRSGLTVEPGLVDVVLDDFAGRAGALPLLSVALVRTWENRDGSTLTVAGYRAGGGVAGAVEAAAEECYDSLDPTAAAAARRLLVRLCSREQGIWVRRSMPRDAIGDDASTVAALDALVAARLLVVDAASADIAHDALLDQWPRLRGWLADREISAELLTHLADSARAWDAGGRADADLYRGARLQVARQWYDDHPDDATALEVDFLAASEAAASAELNAERDRADREAAGRRRLRRVVTALVVVAAVAIVGGVVALVERHNATHQADRAHAAALSADARRLAAEALAAPDLRTALLLSAAAYKLQDSPDTRSALLAELERGGSALFHVTTHERVLWVGADAAGQHLWWLDNTREVWRYDLNTRRIDAHFPLPGGSITALSPDGRWIVATGPRNFYDTAGATRVTVVDAATGATVEVLPTKAESATGLSEAFTSDGRWLAVPVTLASDGTRGRQVDIYNTSDLSKPARRVSGAAPLAGLGAGHKNIAVLDSRGGLLIVDAATGRTQIQATLPRLATGGSQAAYISFDRDDRHLAVAAYNTDTATIVDASHLATAAPRTVDEGAPINTLAFGPSGKTLAAGYDSGAVTVFGLDGKVVEKTAGGAAPVESVAWAGTTTDAALFSGGLDSDVVSWDLRQGGRLLSVEGPESSAVDSGTGDAKQVVTLSPPQGNGPESAVRLVDIDVATHQRRSWPADLTDNDGVTQISLARTSETALVTIVLADQRFRYDVWNLANGQRVGSFVPTDTPSRHQAFAGAIAPDGQTAVVNVGDRRLAVVSLPTGRVIRSFAVAFPGPTGGDTLATPAAFGPNGRLLMTGYDSVSTAHNQAVQQVAIVDVSRGKVVAAAPLTPLGIIDTEAWSPDGSRLLVGGLDGNIWLLDANTLRILAGPVTAAPNVVVTGAFSPDGRTVAVTEAGGTLTFWDGYTLRPLGTALAAAKSLWPYARFTADGSALVGLAPTTDGKQQWVRVPMRPNDWVGLACRIAGTSLTRSEWARYVGDRPYQPTC